MAFKQAKYIVEVTTQEARFLQYIQTKCKLYKNILQDGWASRAEAITHHEIAWDSKS